MGGSQNSPVHTFTMWYPVKFLAERRWETYKDLQLAETSEASFLIASRTSGRGQCTPKGSCPFGQV